MQNEEKINKNKNNQDSGKPTQKKHTFHPFTGKTVFHAKEFFFQTTIFLKD